MTDQGNTATSEEAGPKRKEWDAAFFSPKLERLSDSTRDVLENYSKIPPDQVIDHILAVRKKAWDIFPYPCIGQFRFLDLAIGKHTLYPEILSRMRTGEQTYLDLGCAFAQDVRRLVADGADSSKCYGADLRLDFLDLGYELFRDKETLKSEFIEADIFDEDSPLKKLDGKMDIIGASSFFHLFSLDQQKEVARRVDKLLKPCAGSLVFGRQLAESEAAVEKPHRHGTGNMWRHNMESWQQLWKETGEKSGVEYEVTGKLEKVPRKSVSNRPEDQEATVMEFSVRRLN